MGDIYKLPHMQFICMLFFIQEPELSEERHKLLIRGKELRDQIKHLKVIFCCSVHAYPWYCMLQLVASFHCQFSYDGSHLRYV